MRNLLLVSVALLGACSTVDTVPPAAPTTSAVTTSVDLKPGTAWVAAGEGWADEAIAVYDEAKAYVLENAVTREDNTWAVVLDLDETVMNNVEYQIRRESIGESYTSESWYDWTQEKSATLVPGAADFLEAVNAAGGHVAFVTNRSDTEQLATEENLADLGLKRGEDFRVLLTRARPDGASEKDARYDLVGPLLAAQGYPGVEIVAYLGDNNGDKPVNPGNWVFFCIDQGGMYGDPCAATPGPDGE